LNINKPKIRNLKNSVQTEHIQLAAKNSHTAELADKLLKLNQDVKNFAEVFGLTRRRLQDSDSAAAVLIQSLFHDIRLIRKRKSLWKTCRILRRTLSRKGTQDIPSNPKVTAEVLKQRLQGIQRTLKSKKTSPTMALSAMAELIALQNQVHQVLASLRVGSLLQLHQKTSEASESVSFLPASKFSPLFDTDWYLEKNPDVKKVGMDPLQHYLRYGAQEGRDPNPLFATKWYLSQKPELTNVDLTPLEHYISYGAREGRSPHPEFDSQFYIKNYPESVIGEMTPLAHYLTVGWRLGYRPNPHFDPQFYLRTYPDVAAANIEPFTYFVLQGRTEGRQTTEEIISPSFRSFEGTWEKGGPLNEQEQLAAARPLPRTSLAETHPESPRTETIKVPALGDRLRLVISVLFYHREDLIERFLQSILRQILKAESRGDIECSLSLSFNYQPDAAVIAQIPQIIATTSHLRADAVHILENGFNVGFGAGHNMVFDKFDSDIFLIMNSDVRVIDEDWLIKLVDRFRRSDAVIVGLSETASRLREDGCGIPIKGPEEEFDFVDGSALAVRSDLARRFGLFSPSFDYFYFEDVDLCLRYRQMGLQIALLDAPYEHERSSSSRLLPQFAVENVLDRNRARLFEKWGKYLRTRTLSNRIGVRFLDINRQLQCASLPALFGLLAEHSTAVIDLWGVHEQLAGLFKHPRVRLIPSWQTLRESDYVRYYDLGANGSEVPHVYDIANRMGCTPDFRAAKAHLESLSESSRRRDVTSPGRAILYIARKSPLFDGREPDLESFAPAAKMLRKRNFDVQLYTNYGTFEVENLSAFQAHTWNQAALLSALELLNEIAAADLLVTSDTWIGQLGQLLQKRTFLWLGATSARGAIWDFERASCFTDPSLPCLGCYHQFGRNCHNVCLRGDIACMRPQLARDFLASLKIFLNGKPLKAATIHPNRLDLTSHRTMPSTELSLEEYWPSSTANSVLVLTPVNPNLEERVLKHVKELADRALKGLRGCRVVYDNEGEVPVRGLPHPHRQAAIAALRQSMIERYLKNEQWVFWVDADIVDYPPNLLNELIARAEGGIAAPLVIMEGDVSAPAFRSGFGPGRFYDIGGFVEEGRWARFTQPYFNQPGPVYRLDSVGSCYLVNADLYRWGARHEADLASSRFISNQSTWTEETIRRNQEGPANCYTEHYSVCQFALRVGLPVQAFADLIAYHQKP
jgi:GT2 family glycosyltransferase